MDSERVLTRQSVEVKGEKCYFYNIPTAILDNSYHGCGKGYVVIDKASDNVVRMVYDENDPKIYKTVDLIRKTELGMRIWETDKNHAYLATFSCSQACLFD